MGKIITTEEFINRCIKIHQNKYDYSNVIYTKGSEIIEIICFRHGKFKQRARIHLSGSGCQKCKIDKLPQNNKKDTKWFISKASAKHNNYYKYTGVSYTGSFNKIKVTCPVHGEFLQVAHDHLKGSGCYKCGIIKIIRSKILSTNDFIQKAKSVHNNKYGYSKSQYSGSFKTIKITCNKHGDFLQKAAYHLSGAGCSKCALEKKSHNNTWFCKQSKKIHNNLYNYKLVNYVNIMSKVKIICKKHGIFEQRAQDHLKGHGCCKCVHIISKLENKYFESLNNNNIIRNKTLYIKNKRYVPDGYDPITNTIYEINGDYWHGNPNKFELKDINPSNGKTFGELFLNTIIKEMKYKKAGFNTVFVWESDIV